MLDDPDGVAKRVPDAHVGAIEVIGGLLGNVGDAARFESLVEPPGIVRIEDKAAQGALRNQLAEQLSRRSSCSGGPGCSREISVPPLPGTRTVSQR